MAMKGRLQNTPTSSPLAESNTASGLIQLEAALRHLLSVVKSWTGIGEVVLKAIKAVIVDSIRNGHVANYAALSAFAANEDFAKRLPVDLPEANQLQQHFLEAWTIWEPSYALQERYHILERFLGLRGSTRIVPDVTQPRAYSDMLEADANGAHQEDTELTNHGPYSTPLQAAGVDSPGSSEAVMSVSESQSPGMVHIPSSLEQLYPSASPTEPASTTPTSTSDTLKSPASDSVNQKTYCQVCNHDFKKISNYHKHRDSIHKKVKFPCRQPPCSKSYSRKTIRDQHEAAKHGQAGRF
ncbi:MAG: hypothetical protein FRX48_00415 [Lasallia pustulata]|uniref:C2H2-type domain-containing protein n=1 Tax=Lasallia pustulata TaxID=136370 RepID=A0A5M8Q2U9_9LECA|nr:MAG: hypothetical protein FRX48_00415 [Lasallia pustulata]